MAKRKLQRFAEIKTFVNVFQHIQHSPQLEDFKLKGKWNAEYFKNNNPIVLELGCGKGEYTVGLANYFPNKNFIGIDIKGARLWKGSKIAVESGMKNVVFVRTKIEHIEKLFDKNEVSEIWITFPDPQPQQSREYKRLTSPDFLNRYKNILQPNGIIHLKTDNFPLYEYSLKIAKENSCEVFDWTADLYGNHTKQREITVSIQTFYENKFAKKGFKICYLKFKIF